MGHTEHVIQVVKTIPRCSELRSTPEVTTVVERFLNHWRDEYKRQGFTEDAHSDVLDVLTDYVEQLVETKATFLEYEVANPLHYVLSLPTVDKNGIRKQSQFTRWLVGPHSPDTEAASRLRRCAKGLGPDPSIERGRRKAAAKRALVRPYLPLTDVDNRKRCFDVVMAGLRSGTFTDEVLEAAFEIEQYLIGDPTVVAHYHEHWAASR